MDFLYAVSEKDGCCFLQPEAQLFRTLRWWSWQWRLWSGTVCSGGHGGAGCSHGGGRYSGSGGRLPRDSVTIKDILEVFKTTLTLVVTTVEINILTPKERTVGCRSCSSRGADGQHSVKKKAQQQLLWRWQRLPSLPGNTA